MTFTDLITNAVRIFLKTRLIWLLATAFAVYSAVTALMPITTNGYNQDPEATLRALPLLCGVECLMLLLVPVVLFASNGIAYTAGNAWSGNKVTLRDIWERFKQRLVSMILLTLAFVAVLFVIGIIAGVGLVTVTLISSPNAPPSQGLIMAGMMLLILPLSLIIALGFVALMLDPVGGMEALTRGAKLFWRKAGLVILSFVVYFLLFTTIQILFSLAYYAIFDPTTLQSLPGAGLYQQYILFAASGPARLLNIILMPVLGPIYFILLALIYQDAAGVQAPRPQEPVVTPA